MLHQIILLSILSFANGFWDIETTTEEFDRWDMKSVRRSFFRWQRTEFHYLEFWFPYWDWEDLADRRRLCAVAGLSIDLLPLGVSHILNRRTLISSANFLDPWLHRQRDLRIWALGRAGEHETPYRYRVWRVRRLLPKSLNPEHWHGARGVHSPRHDISIIHCMDQIYIYAYYPERFTYPCKAFIAYKTTKLGWKTLFAGSGYEYMQHIVENYKIFYGRLFRNQVVNCEVYLPKWWGKFICWYNTAGWAGVPNGGPLYTEDREDVGIGCFEIRYNDDRVAVFTDLRYYYDWVNMLGNMSLYEYYEYAYPQWGQRLSWLYDGNTNYPYIPDWNRMYDLWPLGK